MKKAQTTILSIASFTEFGERYVYYLVQSLLIFFLIHHLHIPEANSAKLVGTIFGMVYLSALIGGYIAEKILTHYHAAFLGSLLLMIGAACLVMTHTKDVLFIGLAIISISSGLIKSNISSFIGHFYDTEKSPESQRDFGFNIFYVAINCGAFLALAIAFTLRDHIGFSGSFASCIVFSLLIILTLTIGLKKCKAYTDKLDTNVMQWIWVFVIICAYISIVFFLLLHDNIASIAFILAAVFCLFTLWRSAKNQQTARAIIALVFFTLSTLYFCLYTQLFICIMLFVNTSVSHSLLGIPLNTSQIIGIESLLILCLGYFMGRFWIFLDKRNRAMHDIDKFNIAFFLIGAMFLIIYLGIQIYPIHAKIPAFIIAAAIFMMALSELSLSAIGLSMVTKIAPRGYVSLYMGIWLVTAGLGTKLGGQLSSLITVNQHIVPSKHNMAWGMILFLSLACIGIVICSLARKKLIQHSQHYLNT